ncbi:helix-turn-helix transcriptional regulator [Xanthobacter flavus]|uniref:helix-turn-helix transcriptional regulator n=1 Tax=Xanthobacter flavus TaxID=281 RepID=UPI00372B1A10
MNSENSLDEQLLKLPEVVAMVGSSSSTIYRWIDEGRFPSQLILGPATVRWKLSEIKAWLRGLAPVNEHEAPLLPPPTAVPSQPERMLSTPSPAESAQMPPTKPQRPSQAAPEVITDADGRRNVLPLSLPPRGLSRVIAAAYIGVSPSLFDDLVANGRMPGPKLINARHVWDRLQIDAAFEALPEKAGPRNPYAEFRA